MNGKRVSIDGTKVKANTSKDMLTMKKIEKRLEGLGKKLDKYFKLPITISMKK